MAKVKETFPPIELAIEGIIAVGEPINNERLLEAYGRGIFPWPTDEYPLLWFCPDPRGILDFADLHSPKSWQKFLRHHDFKITFDQAFARVIKECAATPRPGQSGTWINSKIIKAYIDFHQAGHAHSVECWQGEELVGGLYGVHVNGVFAGESMFYAQPNASKLCLWSLIMRLYEQGHSWMDVQMVTPVLESFGAKYISRVDFLKRLKKQKALPF